MNSRKALFAIVAITVTLSIFGGMTLYRAYAQPAVVAGVLVWSVLSPIPKQVANDLDVVYLFILPSVSGGTAPYTVQVWIDGQLWAYNPLTYSGSAGPPVVWSRNAPTSATTVTILVLATDSVLSSDVQSATVSLPISSPTV